MVYMQLINNVTEDWTRRSLEEFKVRTVYDTTFCKTEQVLTEMGICYTTNNYLASDLSTRYRKIFGIYLYSYFYNFLNPPQFVDIRRGTASMVVRRLL